MHSRHASEVLGTTFNISAYPQEEYQTTLVNGSVKVNTETGEAVFKAFPASYHQPRKQQHTDTHVDTQLDYLMDKENSFQETSD